MEIRRDVFQAIADPTRRAIIGLVANSDLNLNGLAENFEISRPAISKHVKILEECGLVIVHKKGRERFCTANLEPLNEVSEWIEKYKAFWGNHLDALEDIISKDPRVSK